MVFGYRFPASENLRNIWVEQINLYYPNFKIFNNSLVCSKHFVELKFIQTTRSTTFSLHYKAVLSLVDVKEYVHVFNYGR